MKHKLWVLQIPTIIILTLAYLVLHWGLQGDLKSIFLRDKVYPLLSTVSGKFTDMKFRIRGEEKPKSKVIILAIDSDSIEQIGRWPWRRDYLAVLLQNLFDLKVKTVGLDIVFSEADERIPGEIKEILKENGLNDLILTHETDYAFQSIIKQHHDKLVLGWTTEKSCQPLYDPTCAELLEDEKILATHPSIMPQFSVSQREGADSFDQTKTPLYTILFPITNIDMFSSYASHAGIFNVPQDYDGTVRKTNLTFLMNNRFYPSLAFEMARIALEDDIVIKTNDKNTIDEVRFKKRNLLINTNNRGLLNINFRGGAMTFPYVSALDVLDDTKDEIRLLNSPEMIDKKELFKDALVIVGVTAIGVYDVRSYPFEENVPGVEGHANILDNLMNNDYLRPATDFNRLILTLFLMTVASLGFALVLTKLGSKPGFFLFIGLMISMGVLDIEVFFKNNLNWISCFLFIELNFIYISTSIIRYYIEEKDKKFIKEAFSNYISPELIDIMHESGERPHLGGAEKVLTAYFTDIQSFSSFGEKLTPSELVELLNEYLTKMTDILLEEGGTLDKYEGDAIIAFFGAPLSFKDHADRACRVAAKMQIALIELREKWKAEGDRWPEVVKDMRMRIGVNSGSMVTGNMGSTSRMNYTMMGDSVNLAARLEEAAKQYGIYTQISEYTKQMIKSDEFLWRELDTIRVVGKSEPVTTFELLGFKNQSDSNLKELKQEFEKGLKLYKDQKWDEAITSFIKSLECEHKRNPDLRGVKTNPSEIYLNRCKEFKKNPPPHDWDGVYTLINK